MNGIRACQRQGFLNWFENQNSDVVCLQEIKAHPEQLDPELVNPKKYHSYWYPAEKRGYSGLAIYAKKEPHEVVYGMGVKAFDQEGRVLTLRFKSFSLINTYFPNSQRDHARLPFKLKFCKDIHKFILKERERTDTVVVCGDFNIAHKEIDLKNPRANKDNAGFLPKERDWMSQFLDSGFVDTFRHFDQGPDNYTWWSYRPGIRERNIGWRLDYFVTDRDSIGRLKSANHQPHVYGSDHCPLSLELKS